MIRTIIRRCGAHLRQRMRDWLLERRIAVIAARCASNVRAGRYAEAMDDHQALRLLTSQRSTHQVLRMEQARGLVQ